jgi:hypothetical protein
MREKLDILEGSGNSLFGYLVRFKVSNLFLFENNLSGIWRVNSSNAIEDRGLSSSIRADDRIDGTFLYPEAYAIQSFDSAKRNC